MKDATFNDMIQNKVQLFGIIKYSSLSYSSGKGFYSCSDFQNINSVFLIYSAISLCNMNTRENNYCRNETALSLLFINIAYYNSSKRGVIFTTGLLLK